MDPNAKAILADFESNLATNDADKLIGMLALLSSMRNESNVQERIRRALIKTVALRLTVLVMKDSFSPDQE